jgi:conjugative transfer signal peptidase TraF
MTRLGILTATSVAALAACASAAIHPPPVLIWNASASVPIGLYAVRPFGAPRIGELVVVKPPKPLAGFLDERRYLPRGVPLLKHVAALPGQLVCRTGRVLTVDDQVMGEAMGRDRRGRPLPVWRGCRRLGPGDVFLMNRRSLDSFDGRYFGVLPAWAIVGHADPLWTEAAR